jgi:hypothetical protein
MLCKVFVVTSSLPGMVVIHGAERTMAVAERTECQPSSSAQEKRVAELCIFSEWVLKVGVVG